MNKSVTNLLKVTRCKTIVSMLILQPSVPILFLHLHLLSSFKHIKIIKRDINRQDFQMVDLHVVQYEYLSLT